MSGGPPPLPLIPYPAWIGQPLAPPAPPPAPALGTGGPGAPGSSGNPLTLAQAEALFKELAALPHIPFNFPDDGCYARAHEMCRIMQGKGIDCGKAWNYGSQFESGNSTLKVSTPYHPDGAVTWRYHVAPVIYVQDSAGHPARMVLDPSTTKGPTDAREWKDIQSDPASRLEFSDAKPFYKTPDALPDGTKVTPRVSLDDDYSKTKQVLTERSADRDERKRLYPDLYK
jgi:glutaminase-like protein